MTTIEELRHEADALVVCGGMATLLRKAASEIEALRRDYQDARNLWNVDDTSPHNHFIDVMQDCMNKEHSLRARVAELEESKRSAKFWEDEAARFCRNEFFYRDLIVKIGEPFGVAARTSNDGSIQQDVLALKVPELVDSLRSRVAELEKDVAELLKHSFHPYGCPYPVNECTCGLGEIVKRHNTAMSAEKK